MAEFTIQPESQLKMAIEAGIDPGISGAIAIVDDGVIQDVFDMPVMAASKGRSQVNAYALAALLAKYKLVNVRIERVSSMPGQGVASMFSFGKSAGIIEGVCAGLFIPIEFVTPQSWKRKVGLIGKDKDFSRTLAIQRYPSIANKLARKKDCGRADAIHIAMHANTAGTKCLT